MSNTKFDATTFIAGHVKRALALKSQMPNGHLVALAGWLISSGFAQAANSITDVPRAKTKIMTDLDKTDFLKAHCAFVKTKMTSDVDGFGELLTTMGFGYIAFKQLGYKRPSIAEKITPITTRDTGDHTRTGDVAAESVSGCLAPERERKVAGARR